MLKLQNVSKFYHMNGNVALGLRQVSLEFRIGEFVAITGESGSGKSTLLNVISGIDYYEEGEIFLNGQETSYYSNEDWENYRNKHIGFVFQNYNLIDSFTVLQNVEIALTLSGYDPQAKRKRALDIIDRVGLTSHINHKASKLSGGQKQRTVIARALAKDTPIIAADEPTGNLDSQTGRQIVELLKEISKDKLVIMVTHNFEEIEQCVTRKIRLFDGSIAEDTILVPNKANNENIKPSNDSSNKLPFSELIKFALRNLVSLKKKSFLTISVFFVFSLVLFFSYTSIFVSVPSSTENALFSVGETFYKHPNRVILNKDKFEKFTQSEIDKLGNMKDVEHVIEKDALIDVVGDFFSDENFLYAVGPLFPQNTISEKDLSAGVLPSNPGEIVIKYPSSIFMNLDRYLNESGNVELSVARDNFKFTAKVVGIIKSKDGLTGIYLNDNDYLSLNEKVVAQAHKKTIAINDYNNIPFNLFYTSNNISTDENTAIIDDYELIKLCKFFIDETSTNFNFENCLAEVDGKTMTINTSYKSFTSTIDVSLKYVQNIEIDNSPWDSNAIAISLSDSLIKNIFDFDTTYQLSIFTKTPVDAEKIANSLSDQYFTFYPASIENSMLKFFKLFGKVFTVIFSTIFIVIVYFVSYVIVRNILKSRQRDYAVLRSLGSSKSINSKVVFLEIWILMILCYTIILLASILLPYIFSNNTFFASYKYISIFDYVVLFIIVSFFAFLMSARFNRKLFMNSIDTTLRMY